MTVLNAQTRTYQGIRSLDDGSHSEIIRKNNVSEVSIEGTVLGIGREQGQETIEFLRKGEDEEKNLSWSG